MNEGKGPLIILMAGLQGVGKTTACAKLAMYLKSVERKPCMVATDVYRPAAIEQLQVRSAMVWFTHTLCAVISGESTQP